MLVFSTASTKTLGLVLLLVLVLYSVQLWTPLRLTGDSIELLSIALSATNGNGFLNHGHNSHYFPGYPAMVVCLNKMHLGNAWSLVGLNEIFLLLGLLAAYYAIRTYFAFPVEWALAILLLTGLSFSLIKHFTLALTDVPVVGVSLMALAFVVAAEKQVGYWYHLLWGVALGLSVGALLIRPVAVALLVCLSWSFCAHIGVWRFLKTIAVG